MIGRRDVVVGSVVETLDALLNKMGDVSKEILAALHRLEEKVSKMSPTHGLAETDETEQLKVCRICGREMGKEDAEGDMCYICVQYPHGSYAWHLASYIDRVGKWDRDKEDAFRSGWLRALYEMKERLATTALEDVISDMEREVEL